MPLSGKIFAAPVLSLVGTTDGPPRVDLDPSTKIAWEIVSGVGAGQADRLWFDEDRQLAASATESLDLAGGLTDAFGVACTFAKVRGIIVRAAASNVNDVLIGGAASAQLAGVFGDVSDVIRCKPGGTVIWLAPNDGAIVTATTADILKLANSSSGTAVVFDVYIIGTSA